MVSKGPLKPHVPNPTFTSLNSNHRSSARSRNNFWMQASPSQKRAMTGHLLAKGEENCTEICLGKKKLHLTLLKCRLAVLTGKQPQTSMRHQKLNYEKPCQKKGTDYVFSHLEFQETEKTQLIQSGTRYPVKCT